MPVDPATIAAVGGSIAGTAQGLNPAKVSAARSNSQQAGVVQDLFFEGPQFGDFTVLGDAEALNSAPGTARVGSVAVSRPPTLAGINTNYLVIAIFGGVALWLILRR